MKLKKLHIDHFRHIRNVDIDFTRCNNFAVLIGNNGSGKSSILELIAQLINQATYNNPMHFQAALEYEIDNKNYYVPVTKYLNDPNDKIKIIIDSLTTSYIYEPNLMSFLNSNAKLNSYSEKENVFFLDFNTNLYDSKDKVLEEVIYSISYSIFDNYDVGSVVFSVDGKNIKTVSLMDDTKSKN